MEIGNKGAFFCDLHTHSTFSDGTLTPEALVELAVKQELGAVALTDHNTVAGCARFAAAAAGKPIHAVCGTEFSTDFGGTELHLLGLFLPPAVFAEVTAFTAKCNAMKEESNRQTIENLRAAGYDIDAVTNRGYCLRARPDTLTAGDVLPYLPQARRALVQCFAQIDSTNSYLKAEAMAGAPDGLCAIADRQTAGRGRARRQ